MQQLLLCCACRTTLSLHHLLFSSHLTIPATQGSGSHRENRLCSFFVLAYENARRCKCLHKVTQRGLGVVATTGITSLKSLHFLSTGPNSEHLTMNFELNISKSPVYSTASEVLLMFSVLYICFVVKVILFDKHL